jgi:hypothetical protein
MVLKKTGLCGDLKCQAQIQTPSLTILAIADN